ncbi:hypothetical protein [Hydrogenophaga pseudoflava]
MSTVTKAITGTHRSGPVFFWQARGVEAT